jgi:hypothetical protein
VPHKNAADVPVFFFGTFEIAWVGARDAVPWGAGMGQQLHAKGRKNRRFVEALDQVRGAPRLRCWRSGRARAAAPCRPARWSTTPRLAAPHPQVRAFLSPAGPRAAPDGWWCPPPPRGAGPKRQAQERAPQQPKLQEQEQQHQHPQQQQQQQQQVARKGASSSGSRRRPSAAGDEEEDDSDFENDEDRARRRRKAQQKRQQQQQQQQKAGRAAPKTGVRRIPAPPSPPESGDDSNGESFARLAAAEGAGWARAYDAAGRPIDPETGAAVVSDGVAAASTTASILLPGTAAPA